MGSSNPVSMPPIPDTADVGLTPIAINTGTVAAAATIVPAVAGKRIWVFGMHLTLSAATTLEVQDVGASSTVNQTGPMQVAAGTPFVLPYQPYPWYSCAAGDALVFTPGASVAMSGRLLYVQG